MNSQEKIAFYEEENTSLYKLQKIYEKKDYRFGHILQRIGVNEHLIKMIKEDTIYLVESHDRHLYLSNESVETITELCAQCNARDEIIFEFDKNDAYNAVHTIAAQNAATGQYLVHPKMIADLSLGEKLLTNEQFNHLEILFDWNSQEYKDRCGIKDPYPF